MAFVSVILIFSLINFAKSMENETSRQETSSVLDKLKSGLKLAGQFFSSEHSNGVANLVSEAFDKTHSRRNASEATNNIFSGFLRVLGFDSKKIGAITVNAIIFIAQLISSSISLKPPSQITVARKSLNQETLFDWVVRSEGVASMISNVRDENLPDLVIEYVKERSLDEETGCVQLLICKSAPFIYNMQKTISERSENSTKGYNALFAFLPGVEEFSENGDKCEKMYPYCTIPLQ